MEIHTKPGNAFLKMPCSNCPFRNDNNAILLAPRRIDSIIGELLKDDWKTFHCHKTVYSSKGGTHDDEGNYSPSGNELMCAGAMGILYKLGRPSIGMRLALLTKVLTVKDLENMASLAIDVNEAAARLHYDEINH